MSADNYIIILETTLPDGNFEFRVKHVLGRYWEDQVGQPKDGEWSNELQEHVNATQYYKSLQEVIEHEYRNVKPVYSELEAFQQASKMMEEESIVEYGISTERYPWVFNSTDTQSATVRFDGIPEGDVMELLITALNNQPYSWELIE